MSDPETGLTLICLYYDAFIRICKVSSVATSGALPLLLNFCGHSGTHLVTMPSLPCMPSDMLDLIVRYLDRSDLLSVMQASKAFYQTGILYAYRFLHVDSTDHLLQLLEMLDPKVQAVSSVSKQGKEILL